jgi:hypothetical protein
LDLLQEIFTLSVWAVSMEITKRVEMRIVTGFVALFLPSGLVVCASGPLVNAALDLMTTYTTRQNPGEVHEDSILTAVTARDMTSNGIGSKFS